MTSEDNKNSIDFTPEIFSVPRYIQRLILVVLLLNLFVNSIAAILLHKNRKEDLRLSEITAHNLALVLEQNISGSIGQIDILLHSTVEEIERQLAIGKIDETALNAYLGRQRKRIPSLNSLRVADSKGDTLYGTDGYTGKPKNIAERDYFKELRDNRAQGLVISKPIIGMISKKWVLLFARRFNYPDGSFGGVVLSGIPLEYFSKAFSTLDIGKNGVVRLRGKDLTIITGYPFTEALSKAVGVKREYPNLKNILQSNQSSFTRYSVSPIDNIERLYIYQRVGEYPLYINLGMAKQDILIDWYGEVTDTAAILLIFLLTSIMFAYMIFLGRKRELLGEKELFNQQRLLETLIDNLPAMVYMKDTEGRLLLCNRNLADFLSIPRDKAIGKTSSELLPSEIAEKQMADDSMVIEDGNIITTEEWVNSGDKQNVFKTVKIPLTDSDGKILGLCGISTDITEQKNFEDEILRQRSLLSTIIESASEAIFAKDIDGRYISINRSGARMLGYSPLEIVGRTDFELLPHDIAEEFRKTDELVISTGQFHEREEVGVLAGNRCYFLAHKTPWRDNSGEVIGVIGVTYDITERRKIKADLHSKIAEMEQFTYSVSHDMRSPLVTIKTFIGYLEQDISRADSGRITEDIGFIRGASDRMEIMLNELLELSRIGRIGNQPVSVTLKQIAEEARIAVAGQLEKKGVTLKITGFDVMLHGDRPRLVQIWQNLLDNAVKYMGDQSAPEIETGAVINGKEIKFFVRDNGIGIKREDQDKIFGVFEKIDSGSGGVGLGLSVVKKIVELSGGRIWVESAGEGEGACFCFTLPDVVEKL
ncbi:MAG: PAS domain-containing protein [Desulfuromonadaceae bacterium]|nr:PAS domain-containing protein [Desulfuromonadaceae bacterium]MDD2855228.1 PAS domain-containing protein [Desulfuromonadaceae bacterium]